MVRVNRAYRRVKMFQSIEAYSQQDGVWLRDDRSTERIDDQINTFIEANSVEPVSIGDTALRLMAQSSTSVVFVQTVCIVYVPAEIIDYGDLDKQPRRAEVATQEGEIFEKLAREVAAVTTSLEKRIQDRAV